MIIISSLYGCVIWRIFPGLGIKIFFIEKKKKKNEVKTFESPRLFSS